MTNDTAVFNALDPNDERMEWTGCLGTREAMRRDGLDIDSNSLAFCPREWINSSGYVDLELVRQFPLMLAL